MYSYLCPECGSENIHLTRLAIGDKLSEPCDYCDYPFVIRAICRINATLSMPEHFNVSTGKYVTNRQAFESQLSEQSDRMSERLGYDVNYRQVDGTDKKALGVTSDGIEEAQSKQTNSVKRQHVERVMR